MTKFKVIDGDNTQFSEGDVVTRCEKDSLEYRHFEMMAELFGMKDNPFYAISAPYKNEDGLIQVLVDFQVVAL